MVHVRPAVALTHPLVADDKATGPNFFRTTVTTTDFVFRASSCGFEDQSMAFFAG
jgi:hypothetical protein